MPISSQVLGHKAKLFSLCLTFATLAFCNNFVISSPLDLKDKADGLKTPNDIDAEVYGSVNEPSVFSTFLP